MYRTRTLGAKPDLESAKGEFLGVIVAPLKVARYASVFENSRFNSDISIALVHKRGKVIAKVPNLDEAFGRDLTSTPLFESVNRANSGTYKALSIFDKVTRIFSYRVLDNLPLIIVVGSNDTESARLLRQNYHVAGAGLAALLLLMLGAGHFSLRIYRKQEDRELRYRDLYAASREMKESMKLAALLFQNSGEAMMVTDAEGKILTVNPAFSLLSGYTEKELVGHRGYELTAGREEVTMFDRMFESVEQSGQWQGAMYADKQQDRNRFNYFAPFMQEATRVRISLVNELREAVDRDELRILYQPIIDLASGKICKAEALATSAARAAESGGIHRRGGKQPHDCRHRLLLGRVLKRFDIDYIKIDPTFVANLTEESDGVVLCEAIIAMAHKLGIKVIAEGIETPQQLAALTAAGCDLGLGYLFSKRISAEELEKQLQNQLAPVDKVLNIHRTSCE